MSYFFEKYMKYSFSKEGKGVKGAVKARVRLAKEDEIVRNELGEFEIFLGVPESEKMTRRKFILLARRVVVLAKTKRTKKIVCDVKDFQFPSLDMSDRELGEVLATNFEMANFQFTEFLTEPPEGFPFVEEVCVCGASKSFREGIERGKSIGEEVNACRRLANLPGGDVTPQTLADEARRVAKGKNIAVKILEEKEMRRLGMGGVLGVGKGSESPPKFIILEYFGGGKKESPIVFVGKGVTFDTGGINLKPSDSILGMNMDMSGGAAVIHAVALAARLGVKKNLVALVPAVENMPSGSSYRPGDVLRSMSGKTIEVLNTDAEGRIILADALHYAKRYAPSLVVDVATLKMCIRDSIKTIARHKNIDRLIHLPVQAGSDAVLKRMNRWYSRDEYFALIERIRTAIPEARFTTDIIVGFPGESLEDFDATVDLARRVNFEKAYIAWYSPRPGTTASKFSDDVPYEEKIRRRKELDVLVNKNRQKGIDK